MLPAVETRRKKDTLQTHLELLSFALFLLLLPTARIAVLFRRRELVCFLTLSNYLL